MASNLFSRSASRLSMPLMLNFAFLHGHTTARAGFLQFVFLSSQLLLPAFRLTVRARRRVQRLPQFSYVPRQAPSGWRLTSSLPATRLSPKPCFLGQIALFWCVYIQLRVTKPKFLQYVQTGITSALQQYRLIDFLSVVADLIENLASNKVYMYVTRQNLNQLRQKHLRGVRALQTPARSNIYREAN